MTQVACQHCGRRGALGNVVRRYKDLLLCFKCKEKQDEARNNLPSGVRQT